MGRSRLLLLILISLITPLIASAGQTWWVKIAWNTNTESDLAGYRIYYKKVGQTYEYIGETTKGKTDCVIKELESLIDHYFVVTAFDVEGAESGHSNELRMSFGGGGNGGDGGCFIATITPP